MSDQPANLIHFEGNLSEMNAKINEFNGLTVVKFGTPTCMPCRRLNQLLPEIARENDTVQFLSIEINSQSEYKAAFNITSVPNVIFFKGKDESGNPQQVGNVIGLKVPQIKEKIAELK